MAALVSCKAGDRRLCQKERLACVKADLDVPVVEHVPFRKTIGDQLSDILHDQRFGGISLEKPGNRVRHSRLCRKALAG